MVVLGSTYTPVMQVLRGKLPAGVELRAFDARIPLVAQVADVDVLIIGSHRVSAEVIQGAPKLRLLQQHGRGVDSVDRLAAGRAGVKVANVPGGNGVAVAELCLTLILLLAKRVGDMPAAIQSRTTGAPAGIEIAGKALLIIGLGSAGSELAVRAKALGMTVLGVRAHPEAGAPSGVDEVFGPAALKGALERADFVCLLSTLTEQTRGMIAAEELAAMKRTAYLVNAARGALVDYAALLEALRSGQISGAAFDTFWAEPADPDDPILKEKTFFLSPHVAGFSDVSIDFVTDAVADNIRRLLDDGELLNVVSG
jgi:D-3-phosphoglycerate dehydrogenase